jgi:Ca2+-transporting ATPase
MKVMERSIQSIAGLSSSEVENLQMQWGKNRLKSTSRHGIVFIMGQTVKEPMFLLLLGATFLYFLLGEYGEGMLMLVAMALVAAISIFQEIRSTHALAALSKYTEPLAKVIREGIDQAIPMEELVPGDVIIVEEGQKVPADAVIIRANDLSVNESLVTGESLPVEKDAARGNAILYQGTTINAGMGYAKVTATGDHTLLGRLGRSIDEIRVSPTQLQTWIARFVKAMAIFGLSAFALIWLVSYLHTNSITLSLLTGLTLAMSAIPEEVPVAFSSFMALGAYKMAALGIVVRHPHIMEDLGAVNIICLDKTGTLTENRMQVIQLHDRAAGPGETWQDGKPWNNTSILRIARLACEAVPFDAMEKAIVEAFATRTDSAYYLQLHMIHEYPLEGRPPMMTHVYDGPDCMIAAAKGAPERILDVCRMKESSRTEWQQLINDMTEAGYRVLGICSAADHHGELPVDQDGFDWQFEGLLALYDPPKKGLASVFSAWRQAGISVKIISGDHAGTVVHTARQAGMKGVLTTLTGDEIMAFSQEELSASVRQTAIYARMFPDAKTRVVDALKANGDIVAMTGDGVNDGPALRSAHIGIAMGKKGTDIAKEAADLIISDDDLGKITDAVRHGRGIRSNLGKAIRYLVTIHIPIILTASLPLLLSWHYPTIFTPIHIIFLELVMGPTCSVFYESEPMDPDIMTRPPTAGPGLFQHRELSLTLLLGTIAATGILSIYYFFMYQGFTVEYTRTIVFITLMVDNILLTFAGRSSRENILSPTRRRNPLAPAVLTLSIMFLAIIYFIPFVRHIFQLTNIRPLHALAAICVSMVSIGWFGVYRFMADSKLHRNELSI